MMKYILFLLTLYSGVCFPFMSTFASNIEESQQKFLEEEKSDLYVKMAYEYLFDKSGKKDLEIGVMLLEEAAQSGNSIALYNLGYLYLMGIGVKEDMEKAIECYQKSSEIGNSYAITRLATMYVEGDILEKNYEKAAEMFTKAIEKGNSFAMDQLAHLYLKGRGVEKNPQTALNLLQRAIDLGNTDGMNNLAILYVKGSVGEKDYQKAENLFQQAIEKGNNVAKKNLINHYESLEKYRQATMVKLACGEMGDPVDYLGHVNKSEIIYIRTLAQLFKFRNQTFDHLSKIFDTPYKIIHKKKCMLMTWGEEILKPFDEVLNHVSCFIPISENTYDVLECAQWMPGTKRSCGFPINTSKDIDMSLYLIGDFCYMTLGKKNISKCNNLVNMR